MKRDFKKILTTLLAKGLILGGLLSFFMPQATVAQVPQVSVSLSPQPNEAYDQFLRRAESQASQIIQQRLKQNPSLPEVRVVMVGEWQGAIAPLFSLTVSRQKWSTDPSVRRWATYFPDSRLLLGLGSPNSLSPSTTPTAAEPAPPSPAPAPPAEQKPPQPNPVPIFDDPRLLPSTPQSLPDSRLRPQQNNPPP